MYKEPKANNPPQLEVQTIILVRKQELVYKLVSCPSIQYETLELNLDEDLFEKLPNLDVENSKNLKNPTLLTCEPKCL